jgi:hypothetical protein
MQQIVNAAATTSFAETQSITPVNCQDCKWSYPLLTKTPHFTDSEIPSASYYYNFQEN